VDKAADTPAAVGGGAADAVANGDGADIAARTADGSGPVAVAVGDPPAGRIPLARR
jgi:hypothetical protein